MRSTYAATKHALDGFFESVHLENKKNGIDVTIVSPGRIKTEISKSALDRTGNPTKKMDPSLNNSMPAEQCARKIKRALDKRKREVLVGRKELLMVWFKRFVPSLFFKLASKINPT
jgi:short-subunit dehydrogenase